MYSPFDTIHLLRCFFPLLKTGFELVDFDAFLVLFAVFCFTSSTMGYSGWIGRVGHQGHADFGQKLLNTQCGVEGCIRKLPIMKWANAMSLQKKKNSLKLNIASHNHASWYTDTDGSLT